LAVWEKDDLNREQIRGVFAIGVLATLFGYQQIKSQFPSGGVAEAIINIVTIFLGAFWGFILHAPHFLWLVGSRLARRKSVS
jgi:ABC-type multidrug transport system permease subunit